MPYRRSKLTIILNDIFHVTEDGGKQLVFVSHFSPVRSGGSHNLNTGNFVNSSFRRKNKA